MNDLEFSGFIPSRDREEAGLDGPVLRLRAAAAARRPPDEARDRLLDEFNALHASRRFQPRWALMAAAASLIAAALSLSWHLTPISPGAAVVAQNEWEQLAGPADGEFLALPYAPPLAPGESVDVVRTQLDTQALERMGVNIALASAASAQVTADLVLGQDGLPRAVRVLGQAQY
jgi:hypothetical protein